MTPALPDSIAVAPYRLDPGTLITARSYLIDRAVPDCEIIALPGREAPGGEIPYGLVDRMAPPPRRGGWRGFLKGEARRRPVALDGRLGMDCRIVGPENWSHFLNIHLPLAFELLRRLDLSPTDLTLILPARTPPFILRAADHLGFATQCADGGVEGPGLAYRLSVNITVPDRRKWLEDAGVIDRLAGMAGTDGGGSALPRRVFLARRKQRAITNQPEIEALLHPLGYVTIYPEDLPVAQQFRLFNTAERIVAVHGAGLAPLLYRHPSSPLRHLVEILPCGHMTDFFRLMAQQAGVSWTGVRGRLKPEYVAPAYREQRVFKQFSLDNFEVDPVSLDRALKVEAAVLPAGPPKAGRLPADHG